MASFHLWYIISWSHMHSITYYIIFSSIFFFTNLKKLYGFPPNHIFFSGADNTTPCFSITSYLHWFSSNMTIFHHKTYHSLISKYSRSPHLIYFCRKITSRPRNFVFLTLFTREADDPEMQMAASGGRHPPSSLPVTSRYSRLSFVYWRCSGLPRVRVSPTPPYNF